MNAGIAGRPGLVGRVRSRQSGLPTADRLTAMLLAAGFDTVDHDVVDTTGHELHLFTAKLSIGSVAS